MAVAARVWLSGSRIRLHVVERLGASGHHAGLDRPGWSRHSAGPGSYDAAAFLALQPPPMSLPSSHPANAASPSPAVAGALKVKEAKVATAAKVKALGVLAGEDCSVNPHVEEAILAGLDDVSAEVRIAAIEAVIASRRGCDPGCGGCCSIPIRQKLTRMVFEKTGPCCWFEPSSKARRLARLALDACGGPVEPDACGCEIQTDYPIEGPPPELIQQILSE